MTNKKCGLLMYNFHDSGTMHMCSMFIKWSLARIALSFVFLARCVGTRRNFAVFFFCGSYFDIIILTNKTLFLLLGGIIQNLLTQ